MGPKPPVTRSGELFRHPWVEQINGRHLLVRFGTVNTWGESPYWQHFTGETWFQVEAPIDKRFVTRRAAMDEIVDWLNFYNHRR